MNILITPPTAEPIAVSVAKLNARIDSDLTGDDLLIGTLLAAARQEAETVAGPGTALVYQTREVVLDSWPADGFIELPYIPTRQIVSVKYKDTAGAETTWDDVNYFLDNDSEPGRLFLAYNCSWPDNPAAGLYPAGAIRIRYRCGYAIPFTVNATTNVFTALGHPFIDGDALPFFSNTGGALPVGMAAKTNYYARDVSGDTFKIAATVGGIATDITGTGTGTNFVGEIPEQIHCGILLLVNYWYRNREAAEVTVGGYRPIPYGIETMFKHEPRFPA